MKIQGIVYSVSTFKISTESVQFLYSLFFKKKLVINAKLITSRLRDSITNESIYFLVVFV